MLERVLIAGSGGQGVVLIGRIVATVALPRVPHITFFPSYGAEVRGGTSHCQVVLSSDEISSPLSERFDSLILMNQASCDQFLPRIEEQGIALINTSLCRAPAKAQVVAVPATAEADRLGNVRAANFIMLGAYIARRKTADPDEVADAVAKALGKKNRELVELNVKAFRTGLTL